MESNDEFDLERDSQKNVFWLHLSGLLKKEILVQIRDGKNLTVGIIFPLILILGGLALATVQVIKDGKTVGLSPFIYPNIGNGDTIGLYYNAQSQFISESSNITGTFLSDDVIKQNGKFSNLGPIDIDLT